jgi:hypothetical protein
MSDYPTIFNRLKRIVKERKMTRSHKNNPETEDDWGPDKQGADLDPHIRELLLKELGERHQYSRFIAQAYLAWYTFFVTVNLAIMGVSLANADKIIISFRLYMAGCFLIFNAAGLLMTSVILRGTDRQRTRINKVVKALVESPERGPLSQTGIEALSAYPHALFERLSMVLAGSLFLLFMAWCLYGIYLVSIWLSGFKT